MKFFRTHLIAISALFILVSCGSQKPMVEDIQVEPRYVGGDIYVSLIADLGLGNVILPEASLPISHKGELIGSVAMSSMGGENRLQVDINVSAAANVPGARPAQLPNGAALPLIGSNDVIVIPLGSKAELYLALDDGQAALGVSIPFKTLDSIGSKVGNASLFPLFAVDNVVGAAGLYFSKEKSKNGFGLFADITQVMDQTMFKSLGFRPDIQAQSSLSYRSIAPSRSKENRINNELYYLDRKRTKLRLH